MISSKLWDPKTIRTAIGPPKRLNDAQIATIAIMAAISFYGNQAAACGYMQRHYGMKMTGPPAR
ncbi:hypothetical protein GCM10028810_20800 [Spirosoma litoris]